jgi:hypothetical protein
MLSGSEAEAQEVGKVEGRGRGRGGGKLLVQIEPWYFGPVPTYRVNGGVPSRP